LAARIAKIRTSDRQRLVRVDTPYVSPSKSVVHGDDLIYRFLRDLFSEDAGLEDVARTLLAATAIWLPPEVYVRLPVLVPYVVRDPSCRGGKGVPDQWSSPNSAGYLRDDNSSIKNIPRALSIRAPAQKHLNGRRMATEFVAAHVWRVPIDGGELASRRPLLNSFVPNLVWLPSQIAKLTDREGSTVQRTLQEMSWARYRNVTVEGHLQPVVEEAWSMLPPPIEVHSHDFAAWNYFQATDRFLRTREARIEHVLHAVAKLLAGEPLTGKVVSTRYGDGLPHVPLAALEAMHAHLSRFHLPAE
jgi:hypothetical protein